MNITKRAAAPVRRFFNPRFEAVTSSIGRLQAGVDEIRTMLGTRVAALPGDEAPAVPGRMSARQADFLDRVDLRDHNRGGTPPTFAKLVSQAVSASQCDDPTFLSWCRVLQGWDAPTGAVRQYNRKLWEWAYIAEAVTQAGLLRIDCTALGFGVGQEPLPAVFASHGLSVLATDQEQATGAEWASTGQLMDGLAGLSRPHLLPDRDLSQRVTTRAVDMTDLPDDLGTFDVIWSSCVIEHLGSPRRGLDFVAESCRLLNPGGIAIHTTEFELTARQTTADYGHCAVYRIPDLENFARTLPDIGCSATFNFTVSMDTREDRWISLAVVDGSAAPPDIAHLKLVLGESVSTSFGILVRRDA